VIGAIEIIEPVSFIHGEFLVGQIRTNKAAWGYLIGLQRGETDASGAEFLLAQHGFCLKIFPAKALIN
jgi:hypothetical protein